MIAWPGRISQYLVILLAGTLLFIQMNNRFILQLKKGALRSVITLCAGICLLMAPLIYTFYFNTNFTIMLAVPLLIICLIIEIFVRRKRGKLRDNCNMEEVWYNNVKADNGERCKTSDKIIVRRYKPDRYALQGIKLRIVHLSDLHIDTNKSDAFFYDVFSRVITLEPDLLFITGDFLDSHNAFDRLKPLLKSVKTKYGIYAVLGNHDFWARPNHIRKFLESVGVVIPGCHGERIALENNKYLNVFGIHYPYEKPWKQVTPEQQTNQLNIALSHTPDNAFKLAKSKMDMVFSGHLHGGQWRFPVIGNLVSPSIYDRVFDHGCFRIKNTSVFVTAGIGNVFIPFRINCPAEILVVDLPSGFD